MNRESKWTQPIVLVVALVVVIGFLILAGPPIVRFIDFLLSGDIWRALLGAALICFLLGLALAAVVGFFAERSDDSAAPGAVRQSRPRGALWTLTWILVLVVPAACVLVALVASGVLLDVIDWAGDRIAEIRGAQS